VLELGGMGKDSKVPEFGGLKADIGRRGWGLPPLRRVPTPGEGGVGGMLELILLKDGELLRRGESMLVVAVQFIQMLYAKCGSYQNQILIFGSNTAVSGSASVTSNTLKPVL
jgi:hypothetical protein